MKKLLHYALAVFALFLCHYVAQAQNIRIYPFPKSNISKPLNNDTIVVLTDPATAPLTFCYLTVENNSSGGMDIRAKKQDIDLAPGARNSMCFGGVCYASHVYILPKPTHVMKGWTRAFKGDYKYKESNPNDTDLVSYTFFNDADTTDSAIVYVQFVHVQKPTSVHEQGGGNGVMVAPNPAADAIGFRTAGNGTLVVTNSLGQVISRQRISATYTKISTAAWVDGTYYYALQNEDGTSTTGRFIVAH